MADLNSFLANVTSSTNQAELPKDPFLTRFESFLQESVTPVLDKVNEVFKIREYPIFKVLPEDPADINLPTVEKSWIFIPEKNEVKDADAFRLPYISFLAYRKTGELKISFVNTGLPGLNTSLESFDREAFENMVTRFLEKSLQPS